MNNWKKVKLSDIGTIVTGNTPSTSNPENYSSNDINFFKPSDFSNESVNILKKSEYYISDFARENAKILPPNSVLVTCIGTIGKVGINTEYSSFNQQINAIIPKNGVIESKYLAYSIHKKNKEINSIANAPVVPIINKSQFSNIQITLPPLEEQRRIAETLDLASSLIEKRKKQIELLDTLAKSLFIDMFGDPVENPMGWEMFELSQIGKWNSGGTPSRYNPENFKGNINWYSAGELNSLFLDQSNEKITQNGLENSAAKLFPKGSLLIGMYDTAAFKMGILKDSASSNQACANVIPKESINVIWLYYNLDSMKTDFLKKRRGVRQKNLNLGMIKGFSIPIPPKHFQNKFAERIESIEARKSDLQKGLEKLEMNYKALMQMYFEEA